MLLHIILTKSIDDRKSLFYWFFPLKHSCRIEALLHTMESYLELFSLHFWPNWPMIFRYHSKKTYYNCGKNKSKSGRAISFWCRYSSMSANQLTTPIKLWNQYTSWFVLNLVELLILYFQRKLDSTAVNERSAVRS